MPESRSSRWPVLLAQLVLVSLICGVFLPIASYDFVKFDVFDLIEDYPPIRHLSWENLKEIFTSRHVTSYYPVRTLSFALDYQIWGMNSGGFKLTNSVIHLASVILLFWLILRLGKCVEAAETSPDLRWATFAAAFGAGLFAAHPLVVEPVTWVAGREELLMALGALGALHCHLTARTIERRETNTASTVAWHGGTVVCCAAACLSNVVSAVIPLLICAWDLLTLPRPRGRRILYATAPLWALAVATIVTKKLVRGHHSEVITKVFSAEWLMSIFKGYWLNLRTIFWPQDLNISYQWVRPASFVDSEVMLGAAAIMLTCVALWMVRRKPLVLFGLLWFGIAPGPASQIMPLHIARADRFLYLPLIGLAIAVAAGLGGMGRLQNRRATIVAVLTVAATTLFLLSLQAGRQVRTWRSGVAVWENCLRVSPDNHHAHRFLADEFALMGEWEQAFAHYEAALQLDSEYEVALSHYAHMLVTCDAEYRDYDQALRLAEYACEVTRGDNPQVPRTLAVVCNARATQWTAAGQFGPAIASYRRAIETDPEYAPPLFKLALVLAMCDDDELRQPEQAVRLAERACEIVGTPDAEQLWVLAAAHAQAGSSAAAIDVMEQAVRTAENSGDLERADALRRKLQIYRRQVATHDDGV